MDIKKAIYNYKGNITKRNRKEIEKDIEQLLAEATYYMDNEDLEILVNNTEDALNFLKHYY